MTPEQRHKAAFALVAKEARAIMSVETSPLDLAAIFAGAAELARNMTVNSKPSAAGEVDATCTEMVTLVRQSCAVVSTALSQRKAGVTQ